jgi:hypothetical protein
LTPGFNSAIGPFLLALKLADYGLPIKMFLGGEFYGLYFLTFGTGSVIFGFKFKLWLNPSPPPFSKGRSLFLPHR